MLQPLNPLRLLQWFTGVTMPDELPISDTTPDAGIFGPGTMTWRVHAERWLILSGARAFLLQGAHPKVAQSVIEHSRYAEDPFGRVLSTVQSMVVLFYGTTREVHAKARSINRLHTTIQGTLSVADGAYHAGEAYSAMEPVALLWVHATFVENALTAYQLFVGPLTDEECEQYWQESCRYARLLSLTDDVLPPSYSAVQTYIQEAIASGGAIVGDSARTVSQTVLYPPLPVLRRPLWGLIRIITMGRLPAALRDGYGYRWTWAHEAAFRGICGLLRLSRWLLPPILGRSPVRTFAERRLRGELQHGIAAAT